VARINIRGGKGKDRDSYSSTVEVLTHTENKGFVLGDAFRLVTPFSGDLDGGLDGLGTSVHGQNHVEVEILCDELGEPGEHIVVKCPRAECER
jgi:hypothetical protein